MTDQTPGDDKDQRIAADPMRAAHHRETHVPLEPDQNNLPLLPYYERFPHLKPPPRKWRRTLRQKLSELG